jgi:hypothetical protein
MYNAILKSISKSKVKTYDSGNRPEIQDSLKKGNASIQIIQEITTTSYYPTKQMNNNFTNISFGQEVNEQNEYFSSEKRVTWVDVNRDNFPGKSDSEILALFQQYLQSKPEACIYKILSTEPILTDNQKKGIAAGLTTLEAIAKKQLVCYGEKDTNAGSPILWNGLKQYKSTYFSETAKEDQNLRVVKSYDTVETKITVLTEPVNLEFEKTEIPF